MGFEWDAAKAKTNFRNHGVRFEEPRAVFDDPYAITIADGDADPPEERFVSIGRGASSSWFTPIAATTSA